MSLSPVVCDGILAGCDGILAGCDGILAVGNRHYKQPPHHHPDRKGAFFALAAGQPLTPGSTPLNKDSVASHRLHFIVARKWPLHRCEGDPPQAAD